MAKVERQVYEKTHGKKRSVIAKEKTGFRNGV